MSGLEFQFSLSSTPNPHRRLILNWFFLSLYFQNMKRTHKGMKTTSGRTSSGVHSSSFPTPSGSNSRSRNSISQSTNYGSRARHYSSSFGQDPGDEDAPRLKIIWLEHENWATAWVRNHFHSGTREPELHCTAGIP